MVHTLLFYLSRKILERHKPKIIGITGSVGKTSTKDMIGVVLRGTVSARVTEKNYNNELGVPLTIIGAHAPGKSLIKWLYVFLKGIYLAFFWDRTYPRVLVLEMGADHPGDIEKLTKLAPCDIGVLTWIGEAHYEFFNSSEALVAEKKIILTHLPKIGVAIGDVDNEKVREILSSNLRAQTVVTTSMYQPSTYTVKHVASFGGEHIEGVAGVVYYGEEHVLLRLPNCLGTAYFHSAMLACAVAAQFGVGLHVAVQRLSQNFVGTPSRMRIVPGIKGTTLIDDSYNASPTAVYSALEALLTAPATRRIAVLGDMRELGKITEKSHKDVGAYVAHHRFDELICVGELARDIVRGAREAGMDESLIFHFASSTEAGKFLQERIRKGDVLLVKGSQGARMEKVVVELMAEPLRAAELVCRQYGSWK